MSIADPSPKSNTLLHLHSDSREKKRDELVSRQYAKNEHIICLVILPLNNASPFDYENVLLPALRIVLEQAPYYWQLACSNDRSFDDTIDKNTEAWMERAHAYIVDTSDRDINALMELGYIRRAKKPQPVIVLERDETEHLPDTSGIIRISYPNVKGTHAVEDIAQALKASLGDKGSVQELNKNKAAHYLSRGVLKNTFLVGDDHIAKELARVYTTIEAFKAAKVEDICRNVSGLTPPIARGYKTAAASLLKELGAM